MLKGQLTVGLTTAAVGAVLLMACAHSAPNQAALRAEYDAAWRKASGGEFRANYELAGSGEAPVARGTLSWLQRGPDIQRFDSDIETSRGEHDLTTLIQSGTHRTVCNMDRMVCSDYLTALQGSDFHAIALFLPVARWNVEPTTPTSEASQSQQVPNGYDGTASSSPTDKCFKWEQQSDGTVVETCFRKVDGFVSSRRFHTVDDGATYDFQWHLISISSDVPLTAFDSPYPVKHGTD